MHWGDLVTQWHSWLFLTNSETWIMTLKVSDWHWESDLDDSIRNSSFFTLIIFGDHQVIVDWIGKLMPLKPIRCRRQHTPKWKLLLAHTVNENDLFEIFLGMFDKHCLFVEIFCYATVTWQTGMRGLDLEMGRLQQRRSSPCSRWAWAGQLRPVEPSPPQQQVVKTFIKKQWWNRDAKYLQQSARD